MPSWAGRQRGGPGRLEGHEEPRDCHILAQGSAMGRYESRGGRQTGAYGCGGNTGAPPTPPPDLTETDTRPFDTKPPQHQCKPGGPRGCGSLQRLPPDHAPVGSCFTTYGLQKSLCLSETPFPLLLSGVNCPLHLRLSLTGDGVRDYITKWGDMDRCPRSWAGGGP